MAANVNNYVAAGRAAVNANNKIRAALAKGKPQVDKIGNAAITAAAREKAQAFENNAAVAKSAMNEIANVTNVQREIDKDKKVAGYKKKARMAGMLAGGAALIGVGAMQMGKKEEENEMLSMYKKYADKYSDTSKVDSQIADTKAKIEALKNNTGSDGIQTTGDAVGQNTGTGGNSSTTSSDGSYSLTGARKELADAIAGPESGSWGYDAFNQGGAAGGTQVVGKSGAHSQVFGRALTDMTLGEIFHKQNTKQRGLSMDEHFKSGGLHAVGRYQFIGSTLQDEVSRMGLSHDTKFTPEVQDKIFFSHIKRVGNISPWIGPSTKYSQGKKDHLNSLISAI